MKKSSIGNILIAFTMIFSILFPLLKPIYASENDTQMSAVIDGEAYSFEMLMENGQYLIPLRDVFTMFGSQVVWDSTNQRIYTARDNIISKLQIGSDTYFINNDPHTFTVAPKLHDISKKAYVEIGFAEKVLGAVWDQSTYELKGTRATQQNNQLLLKREFVLTDNQNTSDNQPKPFEVDKEFKIKYTITPREITQQEMGGVLGLRPIALDEIPVGRFNLFSNFKGNRGRIILDDKKSFNEQLKDGYSEPVYVGQLVETQPGEVISKIDDDVIDKLKSEGSIVVAVVGEILPGKKEVAITKFVRLKLEIVEGNGQGAKEYTVYATFDGDVDGSRKMDEQIEDLKIEENFPDGLSVAKPTGIPISGWDQTGGPIPNIIYNKYKVGDTYIYHAQPITFEIGLTPNVTGIFELNDSKLFIGTDENKSLLGKFNALLAHVINPVKGITISDKIVNLKNGETKTLSAVINPENATNQNVIWEVDDSTALKITSNGKSANIEALNVDKETIVKVRVKSQENPNIYDECIVTITPNIPIPVFDIELTSIINKNALIKIKPDDKTIMENTKWFYKYNENGWVEFYTGKFPNHTGTVGIYSDNLKKGDIIQIKASTPGVKEEIRRLQISDNVDKSTQINIDIKADQKIGTSGNRAARVVMSYKVTLPSEGIKGYRFIDFDAVPEGDSQGNLKYKGGKPQYEVTADNSNHSISGEFDITDSNKDGVNDEVTPVVKYIKSSTGRSFKLNIKVKVRLLLETDLNEWIDLPLDDSKNVDVLSREFLR